MTLSVERLRSLLIGVVVLSSALNYLDRMVLAALAPVIKQEFALDSAGYGRLLSVFSIVYAFSSPVMGYLIDRTGLKWGTAFAVTVWSMAGLLTGFAATYTGLLLCRALLGLGEAGGVPATGKAFAAYLEPKNRALGTALNQVGLTIGSSAAPLLTAWCLQLGNWRNAFIIAGALGIIWLPLWLLIAGRAPAITPADTAPVTTKGLLTDRRFQLLILANVLSMTVYSLWTNWTTLFLVQRYALTTVDALRLYSWIPPIFATAGGLAGGWLARVLIMRDGEVRRSRLYASLAGAVLVVLTALTPAAPNAALATAGISLAMFGVTSMSVNYYAAPLDLFGASHAAFAVSALTGAFGLMQTFVSPVIGSYTERLGWTPVVLIIAFMPLLSLPAFHWSLRSR